MNIISSDIQLRHAIEVLHGYTEHIIFKISIMTDIKRSIKFNSQAIEPQKWSDIHCSPDICSQSMLDYSVLPSQLIKI